MTRKKNLKYSPKALPFQSLSGVETFEVQGGNHCHVVKILAQERIPIQRYAYGLYTRLEYAQNYSIKITATCKVTNCVKQEHLKAIYQPTKTEAEYIYDYHKIDGISSLAQKLAVPEQLLIDCIEVILAQ